MLFHVTDMNAKGNMWEGVKNPYSWQMHISGNDTGHLGPELSLLWNPEGHPGGTPGASTPRGEPWH